MGKVKFRKLKTLRHNPVNLPSTEDVACAQVSESIQKLPVISQLASEKVEERTWACYSIANLVFEKTSLHSLVTNGVSSNIAPLLIDRDTTVREAATGALRNLVTLGADELKDLIINDEVISSLLACIQQCCATLKQTSTETGKDNKQVTARKDEWLRVLENSLHSLSSMSELSQHVLDAVNNQDIIPSLFILLKSHTNSSQIVKAIAQCLVTLTEDNSSAIEWLCDCKECLSLLESLSSFDGYSIATATLVRSLVAGIFHNIYDGIAEELKQQVLTAIVQQLAAVLQVDVAVILANKTTATTEMVDEVKDVLSGLQLSLEIITNLCYEEDDDENWEDMEEEVEIGAEQNGAISMEDDGRSPQLCMVAKLFSEQQIPQKVLQRCLTPMYKPGDSSDETDIVKRLCVIQCRGLTALHALTPIMNISDLGGERNLITVWDSLYSMTSDETPVQSGDEFFEALTAAQLAILEKLNSTNHSSEYLSDNQIQWMCRIGKSAESCDPQIQANLIKLVGVASRTIATDGQQDKHKTELKLSSFADALKQCVETSQSLWTVCEAVDVMYDVFGSSVPLAKLLAATGVTTTLQHLASTFKERFKTEESVLRQHPPHVMGLVEMVGDNLTNFIDYLKHPT